MVPISVYLTAQLYNLRQHELHMHHLHHLAHELHLRNEEIAAMQEREAKYASYVRLESGSDNNTASVPAAPAQPYYGNSSFQSCVISRESGGNSQVMNSSGHYGLYQFSFSTWTAYGGNPADFGNASVAEQNQVFYNAMATPNGASNWAPYDGC